MIHKGEIIEKAVRNSGMSITNLAKRLGKSRRHIYNIFDNPSVSWETIMQIGKIINYDFTKDFTDIAQVNEYKTQYSKDVFNENSVEYTPDSEIEHLKNEIQYLKQLLKEKDKIIRLLENKVE